MSRRRLSSLREEQAEEASINLTPLIDVVFVVLIMFIIIAPMLELDKVKLASARARDTKDVAVVQEESPITIHVYEDNSVWINARKVTPDELFSLLKMAKQQNPH